jgi:hypothetical protein
MAVFRALEEGVRAVEEDTSLGLTAPVLERHPKRSANRT